MASLALLMHSVVVDSYNHAMSDAVALLFSTAAAGVTLFWTRSFLGPGQTHRARGWLTVLAGVLLAFACGSKMNSLVVAILAGVVIATGVLEAWRRIDRARAVALLSYGAGLCAIAVAEFIVINPAILHDVAGGLAATVTEHRLTEAIQVKFLQGHLGTLGQ